VGKLDKITAAIATRLGPDERFLAVVRATPGTSVAWLALGLLVRAIMNSAWTQRVAQSGFPGAESMLVALTDRRVVVFRRADFTGRVRNALGSFPLERLRDVRVEKKRLHFDFRDAAPVVVNVGRGDDPRSFAEHARTAIAQRPEHEIAAVPHIAIAPPKTSKRTYVLVAILAVMVFGSAVTAALTAPATTRRGGPPPVFANTQHRPTAKHGLTLPLSIAGVRELGTQQARTFVADVRSGEGVEHVDTAVYGYSQGTWAFWVVAFDREMYGDKLLTAIAGGLDDDGVTVELTKTKTVTSGSVVYRCAPTHDVARQGSLCTWDSAQTAGVVRSLDGDVSTGLTKTQSVRRAFESSAPAGADAPSLSA
jgi:hypothetical protein